MREIKFNLVLPIASFRRAKAWPLLAGDPRAAYADLAHQLYRPEAA